MSSLQFLKRLLDRRFNLINNALKLQYENTLITLCVTV